MVLSFPFPLLSYLQRRRSSFSSLLLAKVVIRLERELRALKWKSLLLLNPNQSDPSIFNRDRGSRIHLALSTVFYNLMPSGDGLHLTKYLRTQELPLVLHDLCWSQRPCPVGLISPCHTLAVALEDTGNQRSG